VFWADALLGANFPFAHVLRSDLSYMMFLLIYEAAVQPSFCNVVNICEAMSISSIFTLYAMITSMSTMQCDVIVVPPQARANSFILASTLSSAAGLHEQHCFGFSINAINLSRHNPF
jgi:hypothetical protein